MSCWVSLLAHDAARSPTTSTLHQEPHHPAVDVLQRQALAPARCRRRTMRVSFCARCSANSDDRPGRRSCARPGRRSTSSTPASSPTPIGSRRRATARRRIRPARARTDDVAPFRRARVARARALRRRCRASRRIAFVEQDRLGSERARVAVPGQRGQQRGGSWSSITALPAAALATSARQQPGFRRSMRPVADSPSLRRPTPHRPSVMASARRLAAGRLSAARAEETSSPPAEATTTQAQAPACAGDAVGFDNAQAFDDERRLRPARRDVGRPPAGRLQPDAQLVEPAGRAPAVSRQPA